MLKSKIQEDLNNALRNRETEKLETLRLLMSEIKNSEIDSKRELTDEEVLSVIKKSVKKLNEAADMFAKGGRQDLVDQNATQSTFLSVYLPAQLSDEELQVKVKQLIADNQALYDANPKALIGIAMKNLSSEADPQRIMKALSS